MPHFNYGKGMSDPAIGGFAITLHDTNELAVIPRGIMVTTDGDLAVVMMDGTALTLPSLLAGQVYPFRVKVVKSTDSTATGVVGLY